MSLLDNFVALINPSQYPNTFITVLATAAAVAFVVTLWRQDPNWKYALAASLGLFTIEVFTLHFNYAVESTYTNHYAAVQTYPPGLYIGGTALACLIFLFVAASGYSLVRSIMKRQAYPALFAGPNNSAHKCLTSCQLNVGLAVIN